jgi:hypothetical protein
MHSAVGSGFVDYPAHLATGSAIPMALFFWFSFSHAFG